MYKTDTDLIHILLKEPVTLLMIQFALTFMMMKNERPKYEGKRQHSN